jgi:hypothetical protein
LNARLVVRQFDKGTITQVPFNLAQAPMRQGIRLANQPALASETGLPGGGYTATDRLHLTLYKQQRAPQLIEMITNIRNDRKAVASPEGRHLLGVLETELRNTASLGRYLDTGALPSSAAPQPLHGMTAEIANRARAYGGIRTILGEMRHGWGAAGPGKYLRPVTRAAGVGALTAAGVAAFNLVRGQSSRMLGVDPDD